jgi:hypothetical protein
MNLVLKFGDAVLGVAAGLRVRRAGETESWQVAIDVEAPTPALLEPALLALHQARGQTGDLELLQGSEVVRTLAAADCRHGPTLESCSEVDTAPGSAHNRRRVTLEFEATLQDAAIAVQSHAFTLRLEARAGQPDVLRHAGQAILRAGEDPADHEAAILPALAAGWRRVGRIVTRDAAAPALSYEVTDEQVFTPLPAGVDDGYYIISESVGPDGAAQRVISGFFTGAGARQRALELRPSGERVVAARISENRFTRRVDFEFRELLEATDTAALTETLTFTTTRRVIDHPLLDPALPAYRQQIGAPQTEVIQAGTAVGNGHHVSPNAPRYAADLLERRVQYSLPHAGLPADQRWVTTWRYVSRSRHAITEQPPKELS